MSTDAPTQLAEELKTIEGQIEKNIGDPIWQRILIRSAFASIEALVSAMMHAARPGIAEMSTCAASTHEEKHRLFFEVCALSDMSYYIKDNGHIDLRSLKADFHAASPSVSP